MENTQHRWGNFTSSEIWKLCTYDRNGVDFGLPAKTYIREKNWERILGRPINVQKDSQSTLWGTLVEGLVFDLLPMSYQLVSKKRFIHPTIERWSGMPDIITTDVVADIKSPEPKNFMWLRDVMLSKDPREALKKDFPEYFWQLVSNGILTNRTKAELVFFMPKESRLMEIRKLAEDADDNERFKRLYYAAPETLPLMPEDCDIDEINTIRFDILQSDIDELTQQVLKAVQL